MRKFVFMIFFLVAYSMGTNVKTGGAPYYFCTPHYHGCFGFDENALGYDPKLDKVEKSEINRFVINDGNSKKVVYGSSGLMPVVGKMQARKKILECHYITYSNSLLKKDIDVNDAYVTFATNIPLQKEEKYYNVEKCNLSGTKCQDETTYSFVSCINSESTENGCKVTEKGMELVIARNCLDAIIAETNKDGLMFYLNLRKRPFEVPSFLDKFTDAINRQRPDYLTVSVPYGATEQDFFKVGNEAVQIAPGIDYYMDGKFIESVTFEKSPFKNIQEISDHCYDWGKKQLEKMEKK